MTKGQQQGGESAYRAIFEGAPIGMWDEDFSNVKAFLDGLVESGIANIGEHLRSHPDVVLECIQRVRVRHVNRVAREFYGAETEQELFAALPALFDETALDVFTQEVAAFAEGATTFDSEFSVRILNGERRRVVMNVSMLEAPSPDWSAVVVAFTDITERRRLEQSLERANETLRRLNQHLEQFAYAAAHDMREPLRTIALYAQLLERYQPPQPGTRSEIALRYMLENAKRMETLVDDLLRFTRVVEPQEVRARRYSTDPNTVLSEIGTDMSAALRHSRAEIHVDTIFPSVNMLPVHLRQIFQNLLSNAIKYRSADRAPVIQVSAEKLNNAIKFSVTDNGVGIKSEYHEQIFGIFKRLHGHEIEGNGIGLALCRKIVEDYGGRIWVESTPGRGSSFYFTIPEE